MQPDQFLSSQSKSLHPLARHLYASYDEHRRPWPVYYVPWSKRSINRINSQLHSRKKITLTESKYTPQSFMYRFLPKLVTIAFTCALTSGFMLQVWSICRNYFNYATASDVTIEMPDLLEPPDVTLCVRYADILMDQSLRTFENLTGKEQIRAIRSVQDQVTLDDIFNNTPEDNAIVKECLHRTQG